MKQKKTKDHYTPFTKKKYKTESINNVINDVISWDNDDGTSIIKKPQINMHFLDIQFHNDYRDIITAFNNIIPKKNQIFNPANIPLKYSKPDKQEVKYLVLQFIDLINDNLDTQVDVARTPNTGWDESIPDPNIKSGWNKTQESLGLQPNLYNDGAPKNYVKYIDIVGTEKYETEDEVKYSINVIIQKKNINDQMLINIQIIQDKRPLLDEDNFNKTENIELKVIIEYIYILGFYTNHKTVINNEDNNEQEKYYNVTDIENNDITDPKYIMEVLDDKYKQRNKEMNNLTAMLDEEGQNFHNGLPHIYDFSGVKNTRTIYDDFTKKKQFI